MGLICGSQSHTHENGHIGQSVKPPFTQTNVVISFKNNMTEEYQNFNDVENLKFGSLCENSAKHVLINNKYFLVADRDVDPDRKPLRDSQLPYLYCKINHLPLYALCQPNSVTLKKILELHISHSKLALLFNMREEPVFILTVNGNTETAISYSIRTKEHLDDCVIEGLNENSANENELQLRKLILKHAENREDHMFPFYNSKETLTYNVVYEDYLITSNEMYSRLNFDYSNIKYFRFCIPLCSALTEEQFDSFITFMKPYVLDMKQNGVIPGIFIGRDKKDERCTTAMILCSLLYGHIVGFPYETNSSPFKNNSKKSPHEKGDFQAIRSLVSLLPDGFLRKNQVDMTIDICYGDAQNLRQQIVQAENLLVKLQENQQMKEFQEESKKALQLLRHYFYIIIFNAYLAEQSRKAFSTSFSAWMLKNPNLYRIQDQLNLVPKSDKTLLDECLMVEDKNNTGELLSCQLQLSMANFPDADRNLPLYGIAQPHSQSIQKLLDHFLNVKHYSHVIFINLRNDVCVEANKKLYSMILKNDKYKKPVSFHDSSQNNEFEVLLNSDSAKKQLKFYREDKESIEVLDPADVITTKDTFKMLESSYQNVIYHHVPLAANYIQNESVFDAFIDVFLNIDRRVSSRISSDSSRNSRSSSFAGKCLPMPKCNSGVTFNPAYCYFGRTGIERTTFAMTIGCLFFYQRSGYPPGTLPGEQERISLLEAELSKGNYNVVLSLLALLPEGYQRKREVDFVLDTLFETMSTTHFHMREMILATYTQARNTADKETKKNLYCQSILQLERYMYLILFNVYVNLEKNPIQKSFQQWMSTDAEAAGVYKILNNLHICESEFSHIKINTLRERWYSLNNTKTGDIR
ncbi:Hypothetical predicted protein [Argonauta hians]